MFFSRDYPAEFAALAAKRMPAEPTIYLCAQDRDDRGARLDGAADGAEERMLLIGNAPANGDGGAMAPGEEERCRDAAWKTLERGGLRLEAVPERTVMTGPAEFGRMFPGTGGALYGRNAHGWRASFARPGVRSRIPGLFLAGGSVHPGPGLSMAALSGRMAAHAMLDALARDRPGRSTGR
ncbi:MAG: hypothetical protein INR65_02270 [Gluconacetobacter diazotrophicus]|nr:hypothetical protein [Gluconacetobacter diazotrophicus]